MVQDDLRRLNEETKMQRAEILVKEKAISDKEAQISKLLKENEALKKRIAGLNAKIQRYKDAMRLFIEE